MMRVLAVLLALAVAYPLAAQTPGPAAPKPDVQAPDHYKVEFETSKGSFVVEVNRTDAPLGADRFYALATSGFFDQARFFRIVPGAVAQFGLPADPAALKAFPPIKDDPFNKKIRNFRGTVTFAHGPAANSRSTQLFINLDDNRDLDRMNFPPIGNVISGMKVVYNLFSDYGELPQQGEIHRHGNVYLLKEFPELDYVKSSKIVP